MTNIDKKYQVFVSSTYEDLQEERQEVIHALLELDCIPSGMELFPAADEDQWNLIKGVIDDCDYYIVIIGGRYGSIGPNDISYTEMEYKYAIERGIPVIAFLHKNPDNLPKKKTENTIKGAKKLNEFRELAQQKMCKYWETAKELGSVVSRSLIMLQKKHPGIGWVRGNLVPSKEVSLEILNLKNEIERLKAELIKARIEPPKDSELFAQGEDKFTISYSFISKDSDFFSKGEKVSAKIFTTWNEIFYIVSPLLINEASDNEIIETFNNVIESQARNINEKKFKDNELTNFKIYDNDFQTIKVQLRALGLITKSIKSRSIKDTMTYWTLTPYGDEVMTKLRAIKKDNNKAAT